VKCLFKDSSQRLWVTTKEDEAVRLYDVNSLRLLGYLGNDGRLHQQYTSFKAAVYSIFEAKDHTLWLGTKPQSIFRLKETTAGTFQIDHLTQLPNPNIYNIEEDRYGRLWVATLGGGLCYTPEPQAVNPQFMVPNGYPKQVAQRVRYLYLTQNGQVLMAATTEGLIVAKLEQQADQMHFLLHQREANRAQSLSSSAVMDIMRAPDGRLYVSTESGGVNRIEDDDLLKKQLTFRHYSAKNKKLPIDVVQSMVPLQNGKCAIVSSHLVSIVDSTEQYRQLDARSFNEDYRFSDARPQMLGGARWIFGLNDGAFLTTAQQMESSAYRPQIVLTGVSIQGGEDIWAVTHADTLTLQSQERSITIHFAAIDYQAADRISYAFRLQKDGQRDTMQWNNIGSNRSVTLLDLEPGTYGLEIVSTNAEGKWIDNQHTLTVVVYPTFWEAWYGKLLLVFILLSIVAIIIYTLLYIRRIKRQQRDTLEKYLNLIEVRDKLSEVCGSLTADVKTAPQTPSLEPQSSELDPVLQRVMQFVEENISNSEAGVGDMALAAAVSRSGLQRKLKQAMGITPQDLLREARIKRACQLLRETNKTVAEVAYSCGFTDPKYFSRSFKQSTGQSPTEYKNS
jgi:AraC-like DNA-binding protein